MSLLKKHFHCLSQHEDDKVVIVKPLFLIFKSYFEKKFVEVFGEQK